MDRKRVLLLHEEIGYGHKRVAEVIEENLRDKHPEIETLCIDVVGKRHPFVIEFVKKGYFIVLKFLPILWDYLHQEKSAYKSNRFFNYLWYRLAENGFYNILDGFKPDVVVCTYAFSCGVVSLLKKNKDFSLIGVVTDFSVHDYWLHKNVDVYCVANEESKKWLLSRGVDNVEVTGIPVGNEFFKKKDKNLLKKKMGLSDGKKTLLVVGGGFGLGNIEKILDVLDRIKNIDIIAVTGVNKRLREKLINRKFINNVKIFGFVDNVDELMEVSDVLIGRCGGSIITEALAKKLPIIAFGSLAGQEKKNAEFLARNNLGWIMDDDDRLIKLINGDMNTCRADMKKSRVIGVIEKCLK